MFSFGPRSTVTAAGTTAVVPSDGCRFIAVDTSAAAVTLTTIDVGEDFNDGDVLGVTNADTANLLTIAPSGNIRTGNKTYALNGPDQVVTLTWNASLGRFDTVATGAAAVATVP